MAINVKAVQFNSGFLPDIILLTQFYYHRGVDNLRYSEAPLPHADERHESIA